MSERTIYAYYERLGYTEDEIEDILMNWGSDENDQEIDREMMESTSEA